MPMLDISTYMATYMDAFHRDAATIAEAARGQWDAPVPSCPGWSVAILVTHLTGIYTHRIKLLESHTRDNPVRSYGDLGLPAQYEEWFDAALSDAVEKIPAGTPPIGILDLFTDSAARLEHLLRTADPAQPCWTWWEPDQTAGFWARRMAHETAVHRWDAQLSGGPDLTTPVMPSELAADGVDEVLDIMLPMRRVWAEHTGQGAGETYHFHRTDGPGEWLVRFEPNGPIVMREHGKGDVAVRGTASDLLLFLWGRIPAERLEVFGDAGLLDRFFQLAPP